MVSYGVHCLLSGVLCSILAHQCASNPDQRYSLTRLSQYPLARCLDGSAGAYYHRPALSTKSNFKWRIFLQGGAWCTSDDDCLKRSHGVLGSNSWLPESSDDPANYDGGSFLSSNPDTSPGFHDWHSVFVPYCDGSSFTSKNVTSQANGIMYMGGFIRDALFDDLLTKGLDKATDVVLGGCSAGGLAVWLHADYARSRLPATTKLIGLSDAGFFLDLTDFQGHPYRTPMFEWGFMQWNSSATLSAACLEIHSKHPWRCIFAQYAAPFVRTPMCVTCMDHALMNG